MLAVDRDKPASDFVLVTCKDPNPNHMNMADYPMSPCSMYSHSH